MQIADSTVIMGAKTKFTERYENEKKVNVWIRSSDGSQRGNFKSSEEGDSVSISSMARERIKNSTDQEEKVIFELSVEDKHKITLIEKFLEQVTGKKTEINVIGKVKLKDKSDQEKNKETGNENDKNWAIQIEYKESHFERETMKFRSRGEVRTKDGKKFEFLVKMKMKREYYEENSIRITAGNEKLIDPLVLNLNGGEVSLAEDKFTFDLNNDGEMEEISLLEKGSAFLALDKNQDNIINNGSELFGPSTGNGFEELSEYDEDNNGWIDEGDSIFSELKLYFKDEEGKVRLQALVDENIGAIYLGNVSSPFSLKNSQNQLQGVVKNTGIYLKEDGVPGTVQEVNLTA